MKIKYFYQQPKKKLNNKKYKIFISATEQSGDNIGSNIINEILKINENVIFDGLGGHKMKPFLNKQFYNLNHFNSMGIIEIIFSLKKYIKMINFLVKKINNDDYNLVITIDSPDFNFPLAKKIKTNNFKGIKFIHVVAPSVWAWRKNRAKKFSKVFDELLILFNFEKKYFTKFGLKTTFIGHPIYYIKKTLNFNTGHSNIAFLPGSRMSEIDSLFSYFVLAYNYLFSNSINLDIFIPTLPHIKERLELLTKDWKLKVIITSDLHEIENFFKNSSFALVCSGTASLEIAKRNIPQLVIYKLNFFTELILNFFIKVKYANIINIIGNQMIIPEITNSNLNKDSFLNLFIKLINSPKDNKKQINDINRILEEIHTSSPPYSLAKSRIISYLN